MEKTYEERMEKLKLLISNKSKNKLDSNVDPQTGFVNLACKPIAHIVKVFSN